jgi:conjugative transfer signal peptidase TraF
MSARPTPQHRRVDPGARGFFSIATIVVGVAAVIVALGFTLVGGVALYVHAHPDLTCNWSPSMQTGCYRRAEVGRLAYGDPVFACLPPRALDVAIARGYLGTPGPCRGHEEVLKAVVGVPGDVVDVSDRRVLVDGRLLPNSHRIAKDGDGRSAILLPPGRYRLRPGEYWLQTPVARSWDSRYFGPFPIAAIRARAIIVWRH